jgi:hypothetical protein
MPLDHRWRPVLPTFAWALALTVLADYLFYGHPLGGNTALFALALGVALRMRCGRQRRTPAVRWLGLYLTGVAIALLIQPGVIALSLAILALAALSVATRRTGLSGAAAWAEAVTKLLLLAWTRLLRDLPRWRSPGWPVARAGRAVGRWLIPGSLTAVFLLLFGWANPVMADALEASLEVAARWVDAWLTLPPPTRVVFWMCALAGVWGLLRWRAAAARPLRPTLPPLPGSGFRADAIVRCLAPFNLAFAAQNIMDACYLWGGAALPAGMTYAAYAHRGAYPLVATSLLAAAFVLVTFSPGAATVRHRGARILVFAWIAQNVLLTASAAWRLHLYMEAYGLTRLRLASALWMLLVAVGLALICWRIRRDRPNAWLVNLNLAQALALLTVCAFAQCDARIAWHNARVCREIRGHGPAFDFRYARVHGEAALPALRWLAERAEDPATRARATLAALPLEERLRERQADWRSWTWARTLAASYQRRASHEPVPSSPPSGG